LIMIVGTVIAMPGMFSTGRSDAGHHNDSLLPDDWMFASSREKGRVPRAASTCAKHYLRPAAVGAGVIAQDDHSRFGWHNLRHSLATFLGQTRFIP
jgi:hypothetical protein